MNLEKEGIFDIICIKDYHNTVTNWKIASGTKCKLEIIHRQEVRYDGNNFYYDIVYDYKEIIGYYINSIYDIDIMKKHFISLAEWREQQIDSILN